MKSLKVRTQQMAAVAELRLAHVIAKTQEMVAYVGLGHVFSKDPTILAQYP